MNFNTRATNSNFSTKPTNGCLNAYVLYPARLVLNNGFLRLCLLDES